MHIFPNFSPFSFFFNEVKNLYDLHLYDHNGIDPIEYIENYIAYPIPIIKIINNIKYLFIYLFFLKV